MSGPTGPSYRRSGESHPPGVAQPGAARHERSAVFHAAGISAER